MKKMKNACYSLETSLNLSLNLLRERDGGRCFLLLVPILISLFTIPLKVDRQESHFPQDSDSFSSPSPHRPSSLFHKGS